MSIMAAFPMVAPDGCLRQWAVDAEIARQSAPVAFPARLLARFRSRRRASLFAIPCKVPLYLGGTSAETDLMGEQTVGIAPRPADHRAFYPICSHVQGWLTAWHMGANLMMFDDPLWSN